MKQLYLYFDGIKCPILIFNIAILDEIAEWCRALSLSIIIDGYCFRPYNNDPYNTKEIPYMEEWDKDRFTEIVNNS